MRKYIFRIPLLILILIPVISWLRWEVKPSKPLKVFVLDKTTPDEYYAEHTSLSWVLNYNKWAKTSGNLYQTPEDYYGFFPIGGGNYFIKDIKRYTPQEIAHMADTLDAIFYADTYGIYNNNWEDHEFFGTDTVIKVYGGINDTEYQLLKDMKQKGKNIFCEFSLFEAPTSKYLRQKTENLFGVYWSGWTGRYFQSLDTIKNDELPKWVTRLYRKQYKKPWPFSRPGIVLVHSSEKILVLEKGTHLSLEVPYIVSDVMGQVKYDLPEKVHYPYWFEVTFSGNRNNVLAWYHLSVNDRGDSLLRAAHLPHKFPALIERDEDYYFMYMPGDYSDNPIAEWSSHFEGIPKISPVFYNISQLNDRTAFFWKFYRPLITNALNHAGERVENQLLKEGKAK